MARQLPPMHKEKTSAVCRYTLAVMGGKWKPLILCILHKNGQVRYNELRRKTGRITYKTLSEQLKELEADGLILRTEYPEIPPRVEYSLTEKGRSLMPILEAMCRWAKEHHPGGEE